MDDWDDDGQSISGMTLITPSVVGFLANGAHIQQHPYMHGGMTEGMMAAMAASAGSGKKVSDAITYGPRFCELFRMFTTECELNIDITRHLFALVLDYLVDFMRWVRRDEHTIAEVSNLLLNYDYLRPETRNGVIMVIIYMFSSIKATVLPGKDMFSILVSDDYGLGIANKFSLKIYNDPYYYLTFLKLTISALIDCAAVPENERMNVVNKFTNRSKQPDQNELAYYNLIKDMMLNALANDDNTECQRLVKVVTLYWQHYSKRGVSLCLYQSSTLFISVVSAL